MWGAKDEGVSSLPACVAPAVLTTQQTTLDPASVTCQVRPYSLQMPSSRELTQRSRPQIPSLSQMRQTEGHTTPRASDSFAQPHHALLFPTISRVSLPIDVWMISNQRGAL